jgi:mycothiol synthase
VEPIESLRPDDLPEALGYVLAVPGTGRRADRRQVRSFLDYLTGCSMRWEGFWCRQGSSITGACVTLLLPGATAIVMLPTPGELGILPDTQARIASAVLDSLRPRRLHYAQALLAPEADAQRQLLEGLGFRYLAPLAYLERPAAYPWVDPPPVDPDAWLAFGPAVQPEFAATLLATYEDSQDCPELTGLRPIDDIIAAHQASGAFDPALWELLRIDGASAGCILLSRLTDSQALEVVYMGVVPKFRRRGVASWLLRRALERCREVGANRLTLVVDDRNVPAKRVYERFGLRPVTRRDAYLFRWPSEPAQATTAVS